MRRTHSIASVAIGVVNSFHSTPAGVTEAAAPNDVLLSKLFPDLNPLTDPRAFRFKRTREALLWRGTKPSSTAGSPSRSLSEVGPDGNPQPTAKKHKVLDTPGGVPELKLQFSTRELPTRTSSGDGSVASQTEEVGSSRQMPDTALDVEPLRWNGVSETVDSIIRLGNSDSSFKIYAEFIRAAWHGPGNGKLPKCDLKTLMKFLKFVVRTNNVETWRRLPKSVAVDRFYWCVPHVWYSFCGDKVELRLECERVKCCDWVDDGELTQTGATAFCLQQNIALLLLMLDICGGTNMAKDVLTKCPMRYAEDDGCLITSFDFEVGRSCFTRFLRATEKKLHSVPWRFGKKERVKTPQKKSVSPDCKTTTVFALDEQFEKPPRRNGVSETVECMIQLGGTDPRFEDYGKSVRATWLDSKTKEKPKCNMATLVPFMESVIESNNVEGWLRLPAELEVDLTYQCVPTIMCMQSGDKVKLRLDRARVRGKPLQRRWRKCESYDTAWRLQKNLTLLLLMLDICGGTNMAKDVLTKCPMHYAKDKERLITCLEFEVEQSCFTELLVACEKLRCVPWYFEEGENEAPKAAEEHDFKSSTLFDLNEAVEK